MHPPKALLCFLPTSLYKNHFVEEGTHGLHYCELEPFTDDVLEGAEAEELEELHERSRALCHGFLGPFKVSLRLQ